VRFDEDVLHRPDSIVMETCGSPDSVERVGEPANSQPLVSVVILNWNTKEMTANCIVSVQQQSYKNIEIIVVDNGSKDGSVDYLAKIQGIRLVQNRRNLGFTGGNIVARRHAAGEYLLLLNSDALIPSDYIEIAVETAESDSAIAAVGGRSYPKEPLDDASFYYTYQHINPWTFEGAFSGPDIGTVHEVNWVSGSCVLIRESALRKVGYFYNRFFAYYEEADLFARMRYLNLKIVYNPDLRIVHADGGSTTSYYQTKQLLRNRLMFGLRHVCGLRPTLMFLSNYATYCLRGAAKYLVKHRRDAFSQARLTASFLMIPNSIAALGSRFSIKKPHNAISLSTILRVEQTSISFILYYNTAVDMDGFKDFVEATIYSHYDSEFLIVVADTAPNIESLTKYVERNLGTGDVRLLPAHKRKDQSLEALAMPFATKDYIWQLSDDAFPSGTQVNEEVIALILRGTSAKLFPRSRL